MATKNIRLELDAYEKLRCAKRAGETFSDVVRRARIEEERPVTGAGLREYFRKGGSGVSEEYLDSVEAL